MPFQERQDSLAELCLKIWPPLPIREPAIVSHSHLLSSRERFVYGRSLISQHHPMHNMKDSTTLNREGELSLLGNLAFGEVLSMAFFTRSNTVKKSATADLGRSSK